MSLKQVEKLQKYTPLIPYAVGGVIIAGVGVGAYYLYTKLTALKPELPDIPSWLSDIPGAVSADLAQGKETSKQITLSLQEAHDQAIKAKDSTIWWNTVNIIQQEFQDPGTKVKIEIWSAEIRDYEALWASAPEPNVIDLQHEQEMQILETERTTALKQIADARAKAAAELAAEKARLDAQVELERIAQEQQIALDKLAADAARRAKEAEEARLAELAKTYEREKAEEIRREELRLQQEQAQEDAQSQEDKLLALRQAEADQDDLAIYWATVALGKQD